MATATLAFRRNGRIFGHRHAWQILLDGKPNGSIADDGAARLPVEAGHHTLRLSSGRFTSPERSFDAADGGSGQLHLPRPADVAAGSGGGHRARPADQPQAGVKPAMLLGIDPDSATSIHEQIRDSIVPIYQQIRNRIVEAIAPASCRRARDCPPPGSSRSTWASTSTP